MRQDGVYDEVRLRDRDSDNACLRDATRLLIGWLVTVAVKCTWDRAAAKAVLISDCRVLPGIAGYCRRGGGKSL